jgi:hypothetical protein
MLLHGCIVSSQRWKDVWGGKFGIESWNGGGDDGFRRNSTLLGTLLVSPNEAMKAPKILVKSLITLLSRVGTSVALVLTSKYTSLLLGSCFFHTRLGWVCFKRLWYTSGPGIGSKANLWLEWGRDLNNIETDIKFVQGWYCLKSIVYQADTDRRLVLPELIPNWPLQLVLLPGAGLCTKPPLVRTSSGAVLRMRTHVRWKCILILYHKLAPFMYLCFYNILTTFSRISVN